MIPVRVLLVDESLPLLRGVKEELESSGGFEVFTAVSPAAGMLALARLQPDLLIANPYAGRGSAEEWRRAVERYRSGRALSVLVLADRLPEPDASVLRDIADLGVLPLRHGSRVIETILTGWACQEQEESLRHAA
jgi:DNA-binding NarL/FixJ family response regulator